ncbi:MAG: helix-turn-helix transcriptional regulator [Hyphomicrobiaceae bacterium]
MVEIASPKGLAPHEIRLALRINEAATALGIGRSTLYSLIAKGEVKSAVVAGCRLVPLSELQRLLAENLDAAP